MKRYDPGNVDELHLVSMDEYKDGEWVRFDDVEELFKRDAAASVTYHVCVDESVHLKEIIAARDEVITDLHAKIVSLRAENDLLRDKITYVTLVVDRWLSQHAGTSVNEIIRCAHLSIKGPEGENK